MAETKETLRYFVSPSCLSCAACWRAVSEHFGSHEVETKAIVIRQPQTDQEIERCEEARRLCPIQAIDRERAPSESAGTEPRPS